MESKDATVAESAGLAEVEKVTTGLQEGISGYSDETCDVPAFRMPCSATTLSFPAPFFRCRFFTAPLLARLPSQLWPQAQTGRLVLEDGSVFEGVSFGAPTSVSGEVVFNTGAYFFSLYLSLSFALSFIQTRMLILAV